MGDKMPTPKPVDWKRLSFALAKRMKEVINCERCALNSQQKIHLESAVIGTFDRAVKREHANAKKSRNP